MNKTLVSAMLVAISAFTVPSALAADGRITLSGSINAVTCTVKGGSGTNNGTKDFTVTMDSVSQNELQNMGDTAGDTPFSVVIGGPGEVGCTNGKIATLTFDSASSPVDAMYARLRNASGTATGVLVEILDSTGSYIDLRGDYPNRATIVSNTATLNFTARYMAQFTGMVTPGTVETYVMYKLEYN